MNKINYSNLLKIKFKLDRPVKKFQIMLFKKKPQKFLQKLTLKTIPFFNLKQDLVQQDKIMIKKDLISLSKPL